MSSRSKISLPVDERIDEIRKALQRSPALVVTAPPGAGKTTRIPPALIGDGPVLLVQPRRVAARGVARRIAQENEWAVGEEVGWQIRFERKFGPRTKILVVTEGILLARLQEDPLLSEFRTLVLDEVHERSTAMDLGRAFARQVTLARPDFRLVVMSATLDTELYATFLDGCPIVDVPVRQHPIDTVYRPGQSPAEAVREALARDSGHVLCFLPGMREIEEVAAALAGESRDTEIHRLHSSLPAEQQDAALAPTARRKVILATNIAETSITVDGVRTVVDSGLARVMRYDRRREVDALLPEQISVDSADQRAGRAGRTGPGTAVRLWHPGQDLREHREPEIFRTELSPALLEILAWSEDPRSFRWLEAPLPGAIDSGMELLEKLGAVDAGRLTKEGERMRRLRLPPRLGRFLIAAGPTRAAAEICAILAEGRERSGRGAVAMTDSDVFSLRENFSRGPQALQRVAAQIHRTAGKILGPEKPEAATRPGAQISGVDATHLRRALLAGYRDRLAHRREAGMDRLVLASGHGAHLGPGSGVRDAEWLVAIGVRSARGRQGAEARIEIASRVEREWIKADEEIVLHRLDARTHKVRAVAQGRVGALVLTERPTAVVPEEAARLLSEAWEKRVPGSAEIHLQARARVAGVLIPLEALAEQFWNAGEMPPDDFLPLLPHRLRQQLERGAPESLAVPSGRSIRLEYRSDGEVVLAVKLQELFGLSETPTVGAGQPVTLSLLAPNRRPVQTTQDLRNFWEQTYPEVRREMRGRYPRHPWPEDPLAAPATARTKRRSGKR